MNYPLKRDRGIGERWRAKWKERKQFANLRGLIPLSTYRTPFKVRVFFPSV
jgi:hypothetical protein